MWPTSDELTNPDGVGKRSTFLNGPIYWHPDAGAHPVVNHFFAAWQRNGWEAGVLGYPTSDEVATVDGVGRFNRFEHGMIYWHPDTGAHVVAGLVLDTWASVGYERSRYGYPIAEATSPDGGATAEQQFQHGIITVPGPKTVELSSFMPYITDEQVLADAIAAADAVAAPLVEAIQGALHEASDSTSGAVGRDPADGVRIPTARRTGDLFYSDAATGVTVPSTEKGAEYEHGHNGIYVNTEDTVQALDPDRGVQLVLGSDDSRKLYNPQLMEANTTDEIRGKAAEYALTRVGSGYNSDFAFNRRDWKDGEAGTYNCSQLLWAAYMNASGGDLDLDANGWWGVWPKDIRDSGRVTHYTA